LNVRTHWRPALVFVAGASLLLGACSSNTGGSSSGVSASAAGASGSPGQVDLTTVPAAPDFSGNLAGAGSTFINPVMQQWLVDYNADYQQIQISYDSIGSGGGIKQLTENTVQFGATDAPMSDSERSDAQSKNGTPVVHIPVVFGAVVPAYNVPGITDKLTFTPDALGGIFAGKVTKWNDPLIAQANPGVSLPDTNITVVHRSDGSGTTFTFTDYLTKVSSVWRDTLGANSTGKEVAWPTGLGGQGNEGVTATVTQTPGAIGYIELAYAIENSIPFGKVVNKAGTAIEASIASVSAAAKFDTIPEDLTFSATNTPASDGYPITGCTWIILYQDQAKVSQNEAASAALVHYLIWILDKGQADAASLNYASPPDVLRQAALDKLATITWNGTPIVNGLY
jgi:phosphate transport system substrate-binding protein